jgi:transcriptional regulator with XRE-family HTH domain
VAKTPANRRVEEPVSGIFRESMRLQRDGRGWSQDALARRLSTELGKPIHQSTVGKWETGARRLSLDDAVAIASVLNTPLVHMLAGSYLRGKDVRVKVTPKSPAVMPEEMRKWVRGYSALTWHDFRNFMASVVPEDEEFGPILERLAAAQAASDAAVTQFTQDMVDDEERLLGEQEEKGDSDG